MTRSHVMTSAVRIVEDDCGAVFNVSKKALDAIAQWLEQKSR